MRVGNATVVVGAKDHRPGDNVMNKLDITALSDAASRLAQWVVALENDALGDATQEQIKEARELIAAIEDTIDRAHVALYDLAREISDDVDTTDGRKVIGGEEYSISNVLEKCLEKQYAITDPILEEHIEKYSKRENK